MKHARDDYNSRIQDLAGLIPDDEPVFLLRGQDKCAADTVRWWAAQAELINASAEIVEIARGQACLMDLWCYNHRGGKVPDLPAKANQTQAMLRTVMLNQPILTQTLAEALPKSWPAIKEELGL